MLSTFWSSPTASAGSNVRTPFCVAPLGERQVPRRLVRRDPAVGEPARKARAGLEERVVAAAGRVVRPARGAVGARVAGEIEALALVAPAPTVLAERERLLVDQRVVAAARLVVRAAG